MKTALKNLGILAIWVLLMASCQHRSTPGSLPYPAPQSSGSSGVTPFRLNKPLQEGSDHITGTGPAGVPIIIADVTFMGTIIGDGKIGRDGIFSIQVAPLEKSHRIGVTLGDLKGTSWSVQDFNQSAYFGDESLLIPNVGFFYDTALVEGK